MWGRTAIAIGLAVLACVPLSAQQNPFTGEGGPAGRQEATDDEPQGTRTPQDTGSAEATEDAPRSSQFRDRLLALGSGRPVFPRLNAFLRSQQRVLNERVAALMRDYGRGASGSTEAQDASDSRGSSSALLIIGIVAFVYGLIHAGLPGHRKVLLVSYFVSTRAPVRHGVFAGLGVALLHSVAAVLVVLAAYYLLESSLSIALNDATLHLQRVTAIMILVIGAWMFLSKIREAFALRKNEHDHRDEHEHGSGIIRRLEGRLGLLPAIVISAVVPCPGSAMILIFALSLDVLALGLYAVVLFSVGMAITLTSVSVIAILSRRVVLSTFDGRLGEVLHICIEGLAGMVMIMFGFALLLPFL